MTPSAAGRKPETAKQTRRWLRRRGWSLGAGLLLALVCGLLVLTPLGERLELLTHDWRFQWRGRRPTAAKIVLVDIGDSTLSTWEEPLVFWGPHFAAAIEQARGAGASWIALDFIPAASPGPVLEKTYGIHEDRFLLPFALSLAPGRVALSWDGVHAPVPQLLYARPDQVENLGLVTHWPEADAVVRHATLYQAGEQGLAPSLAALLALRLRGESPQDPDALRALSRPAGAASGRVWINYVGPPGSFPRLPLERVAAGRLSAAERAQLKDAVVLIGASYTGSNDLHRGPQGEYPGTEILAHTLATLVDARPLRRAGRPREALLTLALGLPVALAVAFLPLRWGLGLVLLASGLWLGACARAFTADRLWLLSGPVVAMWLVAGGHYAASSVEEARRRRQLHEAFGRHISRAMVDRIAEDPDALQLGGERRELTILFSDIRGFTSMSETMSPDRVVDLLNEYLPEMAACVFETGGTLDKYIGDAVMAFWNAPEAQPDHALRAVATAWAMQQALERLNARWTAAGQGRLAIGIGINTGEVLVGYVGSEQLMNYTVIGSPVNQASRLEGANKDLGTTLLLGEETYRCVRDHVHARQHQVKVKGIEEPLTVYELVEFKGRDT